MAWTSPVDYSTGQIITASIWNGMLGVSGNMEETAPAKVTTAGDIVYGTGTNAIARLGIGSANTVLKSSGSAPAWGTVATTELSAGNDKVFYSNSSGTVTELALGASGTVLTSNGATSAPTFTASAAGGSRSFTASGAISGAGVLVAENADGTVSTVADTRAGGTTTTLALVTGSDNNPWASTSGYDPDSGAAWMAYVDNSNNLYVTAGSISGSTITWGSRVQLDYSPEYANKQQIAAELDPVNNKVWVMWCDNSTGNAYVASFTISGTTITKNSGGTAQVGINAWSHDQGSVRLVWDSTNNQMIAINGTYGFNEFEISVVTETSGTITVGTRTDTAVTAIYSMDAVWDSVSERLVATTMDSSGTAYIHSWSESGGVYSADVTNTAVGSLYGWSLSPSMNSSILLNSETSNKCTFVCVDSSNYIASQTFTIAAGSITAVTSAVQSSKAIGSTYYQRFGWAWDSTNSEYSFAYIESSGSVYFDSITIDNATSAITFIDPTVSAESNMSRYVSYRGGYLTSSHSNQNLFGARNTSTSKQNYLMAVVRSGETTANKFVGISEAAVSDGATGDFTIVGGVNTGVSGLTAPNNYYVQGDGTLATTADDPNYGLAGRALSATSILITSVGDTTVSSG